MRFNGRFQREERDLADKTHCLEPAFGAEAPAGRHNLLGVQAQGVLGSFDLKTHLPFERTQPFRLS